MKEVTAFSPGHITGFFQICNQTTNPLLQGSRGSGISIAKGVTTSISIEKTQKTSYIISINNKRVKTAKVSKRVIEAFLPHIKDKYKILVNHKADVPVGSGLGASGAGALGLALALNEAFDIGLPYIKTAQIAHVAEIECKTGLGTVIAETQGGLEIRLKPGAPGIGEIMQIPIDDDYRVVYLHLGPISTTKILTDNVLRAQINKIGGRLVDELAMNPTPQKFLELSRNFAEHIGIISGRIREILRNTDNKGYQCSMAMFGKLLFTIINRDAVPGLLNIFRKYSASEDDITIAEIDFQGARLL